MINLVWLKRDFRVEDHAPLYYSQQNERPTLFVYVIEPDYWQLPDTSARQFEFIAQSLRSYAQALEKLGGYLCVRMGDVVELFTKIHNKYPIDTLYCHQETGNDWTFSRDTRVFNWCHTAQILVKQYPQQAVFRGKLNRDHWQRKATHWLDSPTLPPPSKINSLLNFHSGLTLLDKYSGNDSFTATEMQSGGIAEANKTLNSFFNYRINQYLFGISSPLTSVTSSSRLSPYLCYGVLSLKQVIKQATSLRVDKRQKAGFIARLHWHSHFVQKLESEPRYAIQAVHKSLLNMRNDEFDAQLFERWKAGCTGVPFIDACMRMLNETGWINFRMRAMLISYASYHLWLDWPQTAAYLARTFVDYEPGIHYPQIQMQSGTTGINPFRIYNPVTQGQKYDAKGLFIRKYIPELDHVPHCYVHTPWLYSALKTDQYDKPSCLPDDAARRAKHKISEYYQNHIDMTETQRVIKTHASRMKNKRKKSTQTTSAQLNLL
ncbi:FAD-binding domain-containing protein [Pseudoalteromonas byunsanensis]|uniref:Deoxyribodipyrimidine photolyase n=1 Tax=Pseudoalteromonas byunsanensis TaxID=327939 RepID=A0A1S1N4M9_9GAMM|nr:FAD-binding domain-containing protein [Pseudoalteromonas byunsanensis]OHU94395.1 deoxyribodipyrimidine photolyase [Pseudoalteromonas byunsanensis]